MVGAFAPTRVGVLIPSTINRNYLDDPAKLLLVMPPIFRATFWTDLLAEGIIGQTLAQGIAFQVK
jgi:hypothetical protein